MTLILGIDPGLAKCGWGIINKQGNLLKYVASGVITNDEQLGLELKLKYLYEQIDKIIKQYSPQSAAIEETFVNVNSRSSLKLAHARGAIMVAVAMSEVSLASYAPNLIKKTVVGFGRAEKTQIIHMVKLLLPGSCVTRPDEADALAIAICHASHSNSRVILGAGK